MLHGIISKHWTRILAKDKQKLITKISKLRTNKFYKFGPWFIICGQGQELSGRPWPFLQYQRRLKRLSRCDTGAFKSKAPFSRSPPGQAPSLTWVLYLKTLWISPSATVFVPDNIEHTNLLRNVSIRRELRVRNVLQNRFLHVLD